MYKSQLYRKKERGKDLSLSTYFPAIKKNLQIYQLVSDIKGKKIKILFCKGECECIDAGFYWKVMNGQ